MLISFVIQTGITKLISWHLTRGWISQLFCAKEYSGQFSLNMSLYCVACSCNVDANREYTMNIHCGYFATRRFINFVQNNLSQFTLRQEEETVEWIGEPATLFHCVIDFNEHS